jgi:hypothetical protein
VPSLGAVTTSDKTCGKTDIVCMGTDTLATSCMSPDIEATWLRNEIYMIYVYNV